ncbi:MAG: hypothetical protein FWG50_01850 [Kiritimatiellaeota bacterium]|nr:hypothetical protein [Kiritimatiellota bacterium]
MNTKGIIFAVLAAGLCGRGMAAGHRLCLAAVSAETVEAPMAVVTNKVPGASGPYLEIPEGAGNPPKVVTGKAAYTVEVPADADYTLWARANWDDECGNSFTVVIDDQPGFIFGEDATYKVWHWVKYPVSRTAKPIRLLKGKHTITFHNREDGVAIDQILLSADKRFVPVDIEKVGSSQ